MVQTPALATGATDEPTIAQTSGVSELKRTGRPLDEEASSEVGDAPEGTSEGGLKVMLCAALRTVNVVCARAAITEALPTWFATIVQSPAANAVPFMPSTEQVAGVIDL